nr:hypothetical protein [Mycobacterium riyadhense]
MATTEVVHPLTMLVAQATTAVQELGSVVGAAGRCARPARTVASKGGGRRGIRAVSGVAIGGIGPVGARRMIRVRGSAGDAFSGLSLGGFSREGGSLGAVTGQPA